MVGKNSGNFVPTKPSVAKEYPEILHEWNDDLDPNTISLGSGKKIKWKCEEGHEWKIAPSVRFRKNMIKQCPECKRGPSLNITHPEILVDWNDEREPADFTFGTGKQVSWKCHKCEHEWSASPNNRITKDQIGGCPCCSRGILHSDKRNSLAILNPDISTEWDEEKNLPKTPLDVTAKSDFSAWWKCKTCSNEWKTNVYNRHVNGCPYCQIGRLHSDRRNSLQYLNPKMASQWHPTRNGDLTPNDVTINHAKKVWWLCDKSQCEHPHEWHVSVNARTSGNSGCPYCAGNQAAFCPCDSIANTHPELAAELHPDEKIPATKLTAWSEKKVLWYCDKSDCEHEHVWYSTVHNRSAGNGCPFCSGKKVCKCNSFGSIYPKWVEMWSGKNGEKSPYDYTPHSNDFAWWQCPVAEDHLWKGRISDRTRKDQMGGCPFCAGKRLSETNCLANTHPGIANQWHPTKNASLLPSEITNGSHKRIWWKCPEGPDHEWSTTVGARAQGNTGCPFCVGQKVSITNCLATTMPALAAEWHPTKNGEKTPFDYTAGSSRKKVWWQCKKCNFEWKSIISNRAKGRGCQECAETGFNPEQPAYFYAMEITGPTGVWWYKGGISSDPNHRRYQVDYSLRKNGMNLEVKLLQTLRFEMGKDAKELESKLLAIDEIRVTTVEKFDGSKELFNTNPIEYANENELVLKRKSHHKTLFEYT